MADNLLVTQGSGTTMASDDISSVHYPRFKLSWGVDGSAVDASASAPLPVVQTGTLNVGTVTTVTTVSSISAVIPGTGATNLGKAIDTALGATDTVVGAGAVRDDALATLTEADGDISILRVTSVGRLWTSATVDAALPAGSNVIGQVTANAGTNLNTSLLALESGGNLAAAAASLSVMDDWDESDRAKVNPIVGVAGVAAGSGVVGTTTQRVCLATDVALPAGTNAIGKLSANSGIDIGDVDITSVVPGVAATSLGKAEDAAHTTGDTGVMALAVRNDTIAALANTTLDYIPITTNNVGAQWTSQVPSTNGGCSIFSLISTGTGGDATNIKASAGQLYGWSFSNTNAAAAYVKVYNSASAPTAGSGTPVLRLIIPGNTAGAGQNLAQDSGIAFATGIGFTIVTTAADAGSTGVAAAEVLVNFYYK